MTRVWKTWERTVAVAGLAAAAAWSLTGVAEALDAALHAGYARAVAGDSATQAVVLIDVGAGPAGPGLDRGDDGARLGAAIAADGPRLVLDAEGWTGCGLRGADGTCLQEHVCGSATSATSGPTGSTWSDRADETGLWIRPGAPVFAALAELGEARWEPLSVHYVRRLPTLPAARVVRGEIPAGTLRGRVVVVGRAAGRGADAGRVATPLGPMSAAQVEAQALLGVLDGSARTHVPGWLRLLGLTVWAVVIAAALRRRGPAGATRSRTARTATAVALVSAAAVALDAGLYMAGVAAIGASVLVLAAAVAGVVQAALQLTTWSIRTSRTAARTDGAPAASGMHKVSGA